MATASCAAQRHGSCATAEGRARRETIGAHGAVESVVVTDPVANNNFVLEPALRIARRGPGAVAMIAGARGRGAANTAITITESSGTTWTATSRGEPAGAMAELARATAGARGGRGDGPSTREELGEQTIEGVRANGTRTTTVRAETSPARKLLRR